MMDLLSSKLLILAAVLLLGGIGYLVWACSTIGSGVFVKAVCHINELEKNLYITFDDGPDPNFSPLVLDVLRRHNAKATFFLIGNKVPGNEELVRRITAEGHSVGNHSMSHSNRFPILKADDMTADIDSCSKTISAVTGVPVKFFRPPFGVTNPKIGKSLKTLNLKTIGWSIRTFDTCSSEDESLRRFRKGLRPGAIVLMHDRLSSAPSLLEKVLSIAESQGYNVSKVLPL